MGSRNFRSLFGFLILLSGVFLFRDDHGSGAGYVVSFLIVISFWYLHGLNFVFSSLRNMFVLALFFGAIVLATRILFPLAGDTAKMGVLEGGDLNPAGIAALKKSHELALELYFDHKPTRDERYYKVGSLAFTQDGIHYVLKKKTIDLSLMPEAAVWVGRNLRAGGLDDRLLSLERWLKGTFTYSLTPGALISSHPLDEFLFESQKGFCEHFAGSVATLLKLSGEKTQVSVGYAIGSWNPLFRRLSFEESDAHAWVEVFDPDTKKWRIVDPTEWVNSDAIQSRSNDYGPWLLIGLLGLFMTASGFLFFKRTDGKEALLNKIATIENKHKLEAYGLTISERVLRIAALRPERAVHVRKSLDIYTATYFAAEPTRLGLNALARSIRKW